MSKKLSFDLDLNAQGFKQGINEAKGATAEYTNATRDLKKETEDYLKSFGSLRKQFGAAKKEAQNLAAQFAALGEAEKNSEFGQELAESLDIAIRKAAELQDVMADTNQAIKNASSDTQGLDAFKDALEIGKDLATAYAGAVAKLTGNEKAYKDMIANVAMIQGGFNAAIKTYNALQPQSNLLLGIGNLQLKARAIAESLATKKTLEATIAQRVFNAVAKANPYVLLATAVVTATAAIGGYMLATSKAASEEKKLQVEINKSKEAVENFSKAVGSEYGKLRGNYEQLRTAWNALKTDHEKNKFLVDNKTKIEELTSSVNDLDTAETFFNNNASNVIKSFELRARAAAAAALSVEKYGEAMKLTEESRHAVNLNGLKMTKKTYEGLSDELKKFVKLEFDSEGRQLYVFRGLTSAQDKLVQQAGLYSQKLRMQADEAERSAKSFENLYDEAEKASQAANPHNNGNANNNSNNNDNDRKKATKEELTRLQELENKAKDVQKQLENLDKTSPTFEVDKTKLQADLKAALQEVKDYKIAIGLEFPKTKLEQLKDELKDTKAQLPFAVSDEDIKKAQERIKAAEQAVEKEEIRLGIKVDPEIKNSEEFRKIMEKLYEPPTTKYDFSGLSDAMQEAAEKSLNEINRLKDAIKSYKELLKATKDPTLIEQIMEQLRKLGVDLDAATLKVKLLNDQSKSNTSFAKEIRDRGDAFGYYGQMLNGAANGLSALGDSEEVQAAQWAINSAAMIAQCVQNIAAMQAEAIASGTASGARLPFPANLAAIATIVATIGSIFASLPTFEEGGVIPGSSLFGDNVLIRANSRERVLTEEQNENFEKIANSVSGGAYNTQTIIVEGKIKGKDLLLVQKNYNTTATKAGQSIKF